MSDFNYEGLRQVIYEATGEDWDTAGQIAKLGGDAFLADNELYAEHHMKGHAETSWARRSLKRLLDSGNLVRAGGSDE